MISFVKGDIFLSDCVALVNPVNCVGVTGAGLAAQFRVRFPGNDHEYKKDCDAGIVVPGFITIHQDRGRTILNFPTKRHWSNKSLLPDIIDGLEYLRGLLVLHKIPSVGLPPVGCGLGSLDWKLVRPEIERLLGDLETKVVAYEPR